MPGFQRTVYNQPAPAIEGDFASANPRASLLAGEAALTAAAVGVTIGRFARASNIDGTVTNGDAGVPSRVGFVHRDQVQIITPFLGQTTLMVPGGLEITLFDAGDFWARFSAGAAIGQKVFASYADGSCSAAATGAVVNAASVTASAGASFTAAIAGTTMTVSALASGVLHIGDLVAGAGVTAATTITALGTGTGGVGTYIVSQSQTVASSALTTTSRYMDVTGVTSGTLSVGGTLTGTGVPAGTKISAFGGAGGVGSPGSGGAGVYTIGTTQVSFASTAVTEPGGLETNWYVHSTAAAGELAKISTRPTVS